MHVALVGADFEENLGVGMIAAASEAAGHHVRVWPFNERAEVPALARDIRADAPDVVGLSIQFQHRAHEFLELARLLRASGWRGHITCGGQFPTLCCEEVLTGGHGVDTVVLHEGEGSFVELLAVLARGGRPGEVAGVATLSDDGAVVRTGRPLVPDLDELPFPTRYRAHSLHLGVPFIPVMGGRGCWGSCSYCSITSFYRDARSLGGGLTLRMRSPENIAAEMALLSHRAGGGGIFCFHDDNFLLPRKSDSIARWRAVREALAEYGVDRVGLIGKCRPETVDAELARELRELGLIRLYVGVENVSEPGAAHLGRDKQHRAVQQALDAAREAEIFACYNLLVFEPDSKLDDVRRNVEFIRRNAGIPVNFCRAEPYSGTPLWHRLAREGRLGGSYLGWDYRIEDDRSELLFRLCAAVFRERNFACDGVANRSMGLGYSAKVLEQFYDDPNGRVPVLTRRAESLTRDICRCTADFLEQAVDFVERVDLSHHDRIARETALLGMRIAAADARWQVAMDALYAEMGAFAEGRAPLPALQRPSARLLSLAQRVAFGATLALTSTACDCGRSHTPPTDARVDAPVDGGMVVDAVPPDCCIADPVPIDAGMDAGVIADPLPPDAGMDAGVIADPAPVDAGVDSGMIWEAAPSDMGLADDASVRTARADLGAQWRDTAPRAALRSRDLPLFDPPRVSLRSERSGERIRVSLVGGPAAVSTRWRSRGAIEGEGREVLWTPDGATDQIRVAVRSTGGVAVVTLRAGSVPAEG